MSNEIHIASSGYEDVAAIPPLFSEEYPVASTEITVVSGAGALVGGSVIGKITASGKYTLCDTGAADGSETPVGILVYGVDATAADAAAKMYTSGCFNIEALTWHSSFATDAAKLAAFPTPPLYVKQPYFAV